MTSALAAALILAVGFAIAVASFAWRRSEDGRWERFEHWFDADEVDGATVTRDALGTTVRRVVEPTGRTLIYDGRCVDAPGFTGEKITYWQGAWWKIVRVRDYDRDGRSYRRVWAIPTVDPDA